MACGRRRAATPWRLPTVAPFIAARAAGRDRFLVAIAGPPGAGKTTLAARLVGELDALAAGPAIVVAMDGFHYDNAVLAARGLMARKGAPETFDAAGFEALLRRLKSPDREVAIPLFDRLTDMSRAAADIVEPRHRIVLVEGNYLLLDEPPWQDLADLFDLSIGIDIAPDALEARLNARWINLGLSPEVVHGKVYSNDLPNARRVIAGSRPADICVRFSGGALKAD